MIWNFVRWLRSLRKPRRRLPFEGSKTRPRFELFDARNASGSILALSNGIGLGSTFLALSAREPGPVWGGPAAAFDDSRSIALVRAPAWSVDEWSAGGGTGLGQRTGWLSGVADLDDGSVARREAGDRSATAAAGGTSGVGEGAGGSSITAPGEQWVNWLPDPLALSLGGNNGPGLGNDLPPAQNTPSHASSATGGVLPPTPDGTSGNPSSSSPRDSVLTSPNSSGSAQTADNGRPADFTQAAGAAGQAGASSVNPTVIGTGAVGKAGPGKVGPSGYPTAPPGAQDHGPTGISPSGRLGPVTGTPFGGPLDGGDGSPLFSLPDSGLVNPQFDLEGGGFNPLLNQPGGNSNPLFRMSATGELSPLYNLHDGNFNPWFVVATGTTLPADTSGSNPNTFTLHQNGGDQTGSYTQDETVVETYSLQKSDPGTGTFTLTEQANVTFTVHHTDSSGPGTRDYTGSDNATLQANGTYTSTGFTITRATMSENGTESFMLHQNTVGNLVLDATGSDNVVLSGTGHQASLDSLTVDKTGGSETYHYQQTGTPYLPLDQDIGTSGSTSGAYTLTVDGQDNFTSHAQALNVLYPQSPTPFDLERVHLSKSGSETLALTESGSQSGGSATSSFALSGGGSQQFTVTADTLEISSGYNLHLETVALNKTGSENYHLDQAGGSSTGSFTLSKGGRDNFALKGLSLEGHGQFNLASSALGTFQAVQDFLGGPSLNAQGSFGLAAVTVDRTAGSESYHRVETRYQTTNGTDLYGLPQISRDTITLTTDGSDGFTERDITVTNAGGFNLTSSAGNLTAQGNASLTWADRNETGTQSYQLVQTHSQSSNGTTGYGLTHSALDCFSVNDGGHDAYTLHAFTALASDGTGHPASFSYNNLLAVHGVLRFSYISRDDNGSETYHLDATHTQTTNGPLGGQTVALQDNYHIIEDGNENFTTHYTTLDSSGDGSYTLTAPLVGGSGLGTETLDARSIFNLATFTQNLSGADSFQQQVGVNNSQTGLNTYQLIETVTDVSTETDTGSNSFSEQDSGQAINGDGSVAYISSSFGSWGEVHLSNPGGASFSQDGSGAETSQLTITSMDHQHRQDGGGSSQDATNSYSLTTSSGEAFSGHVTGSTAYSLYGVSGWTALSSLDSITLTRNISGRETFSLQENTTGSWNLVGSGTTENGSDSGSLSRQGNDSYTEAENSRYQGSQLVAANFSLDEVGAESFQSGETVTDTFHSSSSSGTQDNQDSFNDSQQGNDSFTQHQAGHSQSGFLATDSFSRNESGAESYNLQYNGLSSWHTILDSRGSTDNGTDSTTLNSQGSDSYTQLQTGQDVFGVFSTASYVRDETASESFNIVEQGTEVWHAVQTDLVSTDDGTDSYTLAKIGTGSFTQHQEGHDQAGRFNTDSFARDEVGFESSTLNEQGTEVWHNVTGAGSYDNGTDSYTLNQQDTDSYTSHENGHDINGQYNVDSFALNDAGSETVHVVDNGTDQYHRQVDGAGSTEDGMDTYVQTSDTTDSYTLAKTGQDVAGVFKTSSLVLQQQGIEVVTLTDQFYKVWHTVTNPNTNSYNNGTDSYMLSKASVDSFVLQKTGAGASGLFTISSLSLQRSGHETFHLDEQSTQTWHTVKDSYGSYENGGVSTTLAKDGADTFTQAQVAHTAQAGPSNLQISSFSDDQSGSETIHVTGLNTLTWHNIDGTNATEDGSETVQLTRDSATSFALHQDGLDGGFGFNLSNSIMQQSGAETYTESKSSTKHWVKPSTISDAGTFTSFESHAGNDSFTSVQTSHEAGSTMYYGLSTVTANLVMDQHSQESFTLTASGEDTRHYTYSATQHADAYSSFSLSKGGNSTNDLHQTSTTINGTFTLGASVVDQHGSESFHMDTVSDQNEYGGVGFIGDGGAQASGGDAVDSLTLSKTGTDSYTQHEEAATNASTGDTDYLMSPDAGLVGMGVTARTRTEQASETSSLNDQGAGVSTLSYYYQQSLPTPLVSFNSYALSKNGNDSYTLQAVGALQTGVLVTITTKDQTGMESLHVSTTTTRDGGPVDSNGNPELGVGGSSHARTTQTKDGSDTFSLHQVTREGDVLLRITAFTLQEQGPESFSLNVNGSQEEIMMSSSGSSNSSDVLSNYTLMRGGNENFSISMSGLTQGSSFSVTSAVLQEGGSESGTVTQSRNQTYHNVQSANLTTDGNASSTLSKTDSDTYQIQANGYSSLTYGFMLNSINLTGSGSETVTTTQRSLETWTNTLPNLTETGTHSYTLTRSDGDSFQIGAQGHSVGSGPGSNYLQTDSFALTENGSETFGYTLTVTKTSIKPNRLANFSLGFLNAVTAGWLGNGPPVMTTHHISLTLSDNGNENFTVQQQGVGPGSTLSWDHSGSDMYHIGNMDATDVDNAGVNQSGSATYTVHLDWVQNSGGYQVAHFSRDEQGMDNNTQTLIGNYPVGYLLAAVGFTANVSVTTGTGYHWTQSGTPASSTFSWTQSITTGGSLTLGRTQGTATRTQTESSMTTQSLTRTGSVSGGQVSVDSVTVTNSATDSMSLTDVDTNPTNHHNNEDHDSVTVSLSETGSDVGGFLALTSFSYSQTRVFGHTYDSAGGDANSSFTNHDDDQETSMLTETGALNTAGAWSLSSFTRNEQQTSHSSGSFSSSTYSSSNTNAMMSSMQATGSGLGSSYSLSAYTRDENDSSSDSMTQYGSTTWSTSSYTAHAEGVPTATETWSSDYNSSSSGDHPDGGTRQVPPAVIPPGDPESEVSLLAQITRSSLYGWQAAVWVYPPLGSISTNGTQVLGGNSASGLSVSFLQAANTAVPTGSAAQGYWEQLARQVQSALAGAAVGSAASGADLHQLWRGVLEGGLQSWQTLVPKIWQELDGRRTLDRRLMIIQQQVPPDFAPTPPPQPRTPWTGDLLTDASNFFAGWGDTLSFGLTQKFRQAFGYDDVVDKNSEAYVWGSRVGQVHGALLMVFGGGATGWAATGLEALNIMGVVGGTIHGVEALRDGDIWGALQAFMGVGLTALRGVNVCGLGQAAYWGQFAMHGLQAGTLIVSAYNNFANGDIGGGLVDLFDAGANLFMLSKACFARGTPLLTPDGEKPIEEFREGDWILSAPEDDPCGPVEAKQVEEVFVRVAPLVNLHIGGQVIRTSPEHPFYVRGLGWTGAGALREGDCLRSQDGRWLPVAAVTDSGEVTTVYNVRIADYHTYFVGSRTWGFAVWAHNANYAKRLTPAQREQLAKEYGTSIEKGKLPAGWDDLTPKQQRSVKEYAVANGYVDPNALHNNSLNTTTPAVGYTLRDRETNRILKYGETTSPDTRYSQPFLDEHNAKMKIEVSGTKAEMHSWQHDKILAYVKRYGDRPDLNKNNY